MLRTPTVYMTMHRIKFSDLDPYNHVRTAVYSAYYVDHRTDSLRENIGWDLKTLATLPFMLWVGEWRSTYSVFVGDQEITISSFVREFSGSDAHIECNMVDEAGKNVSRCLMVVVCIDKNTKSGNGLARQYNGAVLRKRNRLRLCCMIVFPPKRLSILLRIYAIDLYLSLKGKTCLAPMDA